MRTNDKRNNVYTAENKLVVTGGKPVQWKTPWGRSVPQLGIRPRTLDIASRSVRQGLGHADKWTLTIVRYSIFF